MAIFRIFAICILVSCFHGGVAVGQTASSITWKECLRQDEVWYGGGEAVRIADNVLAYQRSSGGWPKNLDMARVLSDDERADILRQKDARDATLDNGATCTQLRYLTLVLQRTSIDRFRLPIILGVEYLLAAQYPNGGWPMIYPVRKGYTAHITFNDNAMIGAMSLLDDVAKGRQGFVFIDEELRERAQRAVEKGVTCILRCQVVHEGIRTVWCAQHDEQTLLPAPGRKFEPIALSGAESADITSFLMRIEPPSDSIVVAVQAAVAWFDRVKIPGIRQILVDDSLAPEGKNKVIVADSLAGPMWARFYDITSGRPIFTDRDGVPRNSLADLGYERRNHYDWLGYWPKSLLARKYPSWAKKYNLTSVLR